MTALAREELETGWTVSRASMILFALLCFFCSTNPVQGQPSSAPPREVSGQCPDGQEALLEVDVVGHEHNSHHPIACRVFGARDSHLWSRDSADPLSFDLPLHELIRDFPVLAPKNPRKPTYRQQLLGRVLWLEAVFYNSNAYFEELAMAILDHLDALGVAYRLRQESSSGITFAIDDDEDHVTTVSVWCLEEPATCRVTALRKWRLVAQEVE